MSVAFDLDPGSEAPRPTRTCPRERPLATVTTLHPPSARSSAAPLRLTRRGTGVVIAAVATLAAALVGLAWLSAPAARPASGPMPDTVVVRAGDSLWRIAGRIAPDRDPLAEVDQLRRVNHLRGSSLYPGQVLRTH